MLKFYLIVTVLILLRLGNINQSLWLDEAITAQKAKSLSYRELVTKYSIADFHPPGHYFVVKTFGDLLGYSELTVRLPSLLACILAAIFVYKLGGKWACILFLANPLVFYYSQEARMYMLSVGLLTGTWYGIGKNKWWANLWGFFALLTFYGSIYFLIALLFAYKKNWKVVLPGMALALGVVSPLLILQLENSKLMLAQIKNWDLVLGKAEIKNLILIPIKFFTGRVSFYPKMLYFILGGFWASWVALLAIAKSNKKLLIWPIGMAFLVSFWAPMMQYFRFLYLIPVLCLGLAKYGQKTKIALLIVSLLWISFYVLNPIEWREDWKGLSESLPAKSTILLPLNFSDPIIFYRPDVQIADISQTTTLGVVYSTNYGSDIIGIDYNKYMSNKGYMKTFEKSFHQIRLDTWEKTKVLE